MCTKCLCIAVLCIFYKSFPMISDQSKCSKYLTTSFPVMDILVVVCYGLLHTQMRTWADCSGFDGFFLSTPERIYSKLEVAT